MNKMARFIVWLCNKFNRVELEYIVSELTSILKSKNPEIKLKDDFKETHPNYRNFEVDDKLPLKEPSLKKNAQS